MWGLSEQLLAAIFDSLAIANWQRGGDENAKRPERLPRPGVENKPDGQMLVQGKGVSIQEMNRQLGW
jgi:hypothetical protein